MDTGHSYFCYCFEDINFKIIFQLLEWFFSSFFFFLIFILSFIKFPLSMFIYNPRFTPTPCNIFLAFVPISFYPSLNNLFMRVHWFSRLSHWRGKNRSKKKQTNYAIFAFMWNEIYIQRLFKKKRRNVFFIWWKILFGKEFLYNS